MVFEEIKRLNVRVLLDAFELRVNKLSGDTRPRSWNMTRYVLVPLTEYPHNLLAGVDRDEGDGCYSVRTFRQAGLRDEQRGSGL